jgi:hypothetical protein
VFIVVSPGEAAIMPANWRGTQQQFVERLGKFCEYRRHRRPSLKQAGSCAGLGALDKS